MTELKYRPDVDGLRAVAVGLVLLFHAELGWTGGFIGVDVFFVISGYLITGLILRQRAAGTFSLKNFWLRRIRRILPAAAAVVLATLVLGAWLLYPDDYAELAQSAFAQQLMLANVFFWKTSSYFAGPSELKPLLHTWSLAVEEQFYLGYPLLLIWLTRPTARGPGKILLALTLASFALCVQGTHQHQQASFFLLPTRAWEMLLGGLIWYAPQGRRLSDRQAGVLSAGALVTILIAGWLYSAETVFPGAAAAVPCIATAALIHIGSEHQTPIHRALAARGCVRVGLLSYSLYLWHWPLLVFARHLNAEPLEAAQRLAAVLLSFPLAWISWRFIETPIRRGIVFTKPRTVWLGAGASLVTLLVMCAAIARTDGLPGRFDKATQRLLASMDNSRFRDTVSLHELRSGNVPRFGHPSGKPRVLVWGDSHAMTLIPAIDAVCRQQRVSGLQATYTGTLPLCAFSAGRKWEAPPEFGDAVLQLVKNTGVDTVVLAGYWSRDVNRADFEAALRETVRRLVDLGCHVVVVRDTPELPLSPKQQVLSAVRRETDVGSLGIPLAAHRLRQAASDRVLLGLNEDPRVTVIDPAPLLVEGENRLPLVVDGVCLYQNEDHLSESGALRLVPMFERALRPPAIAERPGTKPEL